jgi:hypothetical protein
MSQTPASWQNDPYGRFQQRYWDGTKWTEHVATGGQQQVDPLGASAVVPFAIPSTAVPASSPSAIDATQAFAAPAGSAAGGRVVATLDAMRPDSEERRTPSLIAALAGLGGVLVAFGALIATGDDPSEGVIIAVSVAIIAAAVAVKWYLATRPQAGAAALGALVVGLVGLGVGIALATERGPGVLVYGVVGGLHVVAWLLKPFRGKTLLLGLGSLVLVGALASLPDAFDGGSDDDAIAECQGFLDDGDFDRFDAENCDDVFFSDFEDAGNDVLPGVFTDSVGTTGWIYLLSSAGLLGATWWLDRKDYRGTATGLAASGLVSATIGASLLAEDFGDSGGPLLVTIVGVVVCVVGSHGGRRATTWWGAALATTGLVALLVSIIEPSSDGSTSAVVVLAGALLIATPALVRAVRQSQQGSEPQPPSPATTAPPTAPPSAPPTGFPSMPPPTAPPT